VTIEQPDYVFFDLDPFEPAAYPEVLAVARMVKVLCERLGLTAYPKTSGATGMQIYVPIAPGFSYEETRALVGSLGQLMRQADPAHITMEWEVRKRTGKVFVDHNMNRVGANISAAWSMRPEPGATVSTPVTWDEVEDGAVRASDFTIRTIWDRIATVGDPFRPVVDGPYQDLSPALESLGIERVPPPSPNGASPDGDGTADGPAKATARAQAAGNRRSKDDETIARSKDPNLRTYLKKRSFGDEGTPEPEGGGPSAGGNSFVIQWHDATRLHHDYRLERNGVLVSWAVPKGLPWEPGEKHLAVQTEDHPMEYGTFAGSIPSGHYGAGEVRIWDSGTYDLVEWTDSKVSVRLHGRRHTGEYHLIKTRTDWLVFLAKSSEIRPPALPPKLTPMFAEAGHDPFDRAGWRFEPKLDGIRTLLSFDRQAFRLISRTGRDMTSSYPDLKDLFRRVVAINALIDAEIVATDEQGHPSFERLQQRMNLASPSEIERTAKQIPVELYAFDLLWFDGRDVMSLPLSERLELLDEVIVEGKRMRKMFGVEEHGIAFAKQAQELFFEGTVAKRLNSRYAPGRRTPDWQKIKFLNRQDCVVLGWTPGQGGRANSFGALLVGAYVDGELRWVGQVGTGFTDQMIKSLMKRLGDLVVDAPAIRDPELKRVKGARWVRPELVVDVEYLQMTRVGKMRAPSFKGIRIDKLPEDAVMEPQAVGTIAEDGEEGEEEAEAPKARPATKKPAAARKTSTAAKKTSTAAKKPTAAKRTSTSGKKPPAKKPAAAKRATPAARTRRGSA
jgi:bifunctional non-homologous end joining protein LigD